MPNPTSKSTLLKKLRYAFVLIGFDVKLTKVSLGLDEQYYYKSMVSVMPDGIQIGELRYNPKHHPNVKYDIYTPDGEELGAYYLFSRMFNDLVLAIINNRLDHESASLDYTLEGPPEKEEFPY